MSVTADVIARAASIPTAVLSDALGGRGVLSPEIAPLGPSMEICGRARTAQCARGDVLASLRTLISAERGEVLVVAGPGVPLACLGAFMTETCRERGMAGAVLDAYVRDQNEICRSGFPVFCRGATPRIATSGDPGRSQVRVRCGGVSVSPGDLIRADTDGVVVIEWADVEAVLDHAESILEKEAHALQQMREGAGLEALYGDYIRIEAES